MKLIPSCLSRFGAISLLASTSVFAGPDQVIETSAVPEDPVAADDMFADRLFGDWGGMRTNWADRGLSVDLDGWYHLQGVADGGTSRGDDVGNLFSGRLGMKLDTDKAGLWQGGFFSLKLEGRGGSSVLGNAGATSPVNNAALLPLVPGRLSDDAWALTEVSFTQFLSEKFALTGGLLNTTFGDANAISGSLGSNSHFMNTSFLYAPVVGSSVPTVTLGGGAVFIPSPNIMGSFIVMGSNETAGNNPFDNYEGTTFATEWTFKHELGGNPGGMTFGGTYSIDQERFRISANPRVLLQDLGSGRGVFSDDDVWSAYWNGFQFLDGDENGGWGLFGRLGITDGDTSVIDWTGAAGVGGVGLLPNRDADRWGLGFYYGEAVDEGILAAAGYSEEIGGELFYNMQITPAMNLTFDVQVVDSALPIADTAVVLGLRLGVRF